MKASSGVGAAGFGMGRIFLCAGLGLALVWGAAGCRQAPPAASSDNGAGQNGADPADANMASGSGGGGYAPGQPTRVLGQRAQDSGQQQGEDYSQQPPAPIVRQAPDSGDQPADNGGALNSDGTMSDAQAQDVYASDLTDEQASDPPPPLPQYDQPPAPDPDYLWTPGYWAWGPGGYYWVPGAWAGAPYAGALWTPGYWGWYGGFYRFHRGYWGLHIGFYGGVDYGYGYGGHGYYGGYWNGGHFFYNTAVNRVNVNVIRNVYVHNEGNVRITNRVSYNGGRGGLAARPLPAEARVLHEQRIPPMASQVQAQHEAAQNKQQFYNVNQGRPGMAVAAHAVVADHTLPPALPRAAAPVAQPGFHGETRPGQPQGLVQGAHPQVQPQPGQVHNQLAPAAGRPAPEFKPVQPGHVESQPVKPAPEFKPVQPNHPEPQPVRPAPEFKPVQPSAPERPAPEIHPAAPQNAPKPEERTAPPAVTPPHPPPPKPPPPKPAPKPEEKPH